MPSVEGWKKCIGLREGVVYEGKFKKGGVGHKGTIDLFASDDTDLGIGVCEL